MLKSYFRIALRNLSKNRIFSVINIAGLTVGLACCILIALFVYDELNYDTYPQHASQIYRVGINVTGNGNIVTYPNADVGVGPGIQKEYPEVEAFCRILPQAEGFLSYGNKQFKEKKLAFADSSFLQFFSIPLIDGDPKTALTEQNTFIISKDFANKYFGDEEPVGKTMSYGRGVLKVTGVFDKIPDNSHFHFDAFISMATMHLNSQTWSNIGFYTYLMLNKNADAKAIEKKFPELVAKYVVPEVQHDMGVSLAEAQKSVNTFIFFLQPLRKIHLYSDTKYELEANGDIHYVYIFSALAVFILLLACVNFTNLATAYASKRSKEVGIRKVMGSLKKELILQFLTESILVSFCALLIACILAFALLPYFNQLSGKNLDYHALLSYKSILSLVFLGLLSGICAGIYPAFFLSSMNAIKVLKNSFFSKGNNKNILRSSLVVFQFFVSTSLIIATIIVYQQLRYMQDKKLGYDKEQVLYLEDTYLIGNRAVRSAFRQDLSNDSRVVNASIGTDIPGNTNTDGTEIYPKEKEANENDFEIHTTIYHVDYDYLSTMGMKIIEGRNFSKDFPTDSFATVINQAAVHDLGWDRTNPIGKTIVTSGQHEFKVIGVVADFHYASVKQKIAPLMMRLDRPGSGLIIKVKTDDLQNFLKDLEKKWKTLNAGAPFSYYFLNNHFAYLYSAEQRTGQIFGVFASIAIIIASLGLFGLAAFTTEQRAKEIGIRKVLGASVQQVLLLVSKEFLLLIFIGFSTAIPFTWWMMNKWLMDFAYRIHIGISVFALACSTSILIALITISFRAIRAAVMNPVKSLRTE
ncbi:MAG TPA: ABC transporter permease [Puia sp.]|nr:ABC transporter permease [Puia sp.]